MSDDKTQDRLFDYLLTRVRTRESSTLVIATVATSASVVLFAVKYVNISMLQLFIGILFPLLGFCYREITIRTIDNADRKDIHLLMHDRQNKLNACLPHIQQWSRMREALFRAFLLLPSFVWLFVWSLTLDNLYISYAIIGASFMGYGIVVWLRPYNKAD